MLDTPADLCRVVLRRNLIKNPAGLQVRTMLLPLDMLSAGEMAEVADVAGEPAWVGRLAELGIRAGCRLQVLQPGSPCLLQVDDCKLCLRGNDCSQILVRPVTA